VLIVTCRCGQTVDLGGTSPLSNRTTSTKGTVPNLFEGTVTIPQLVEPVAHVGIARTWTSYCSPLSV